MLSRARPAAGSAPLKCFRRPEREPFPYIFKRRTERTMATEETVHSARALLILRRALGVGLALVAAAGMLFSLDALYEFRSTPERTVAAVAGQTVSLHGTAPISQDGRPPSVEVLPADEASAPAVERISTERSLVDKDAIAWISSVKLADLSETASLRFDVVFSDEPTRRERWTINVYPTEEALRQASGSVAYALFGVEPLRLAGACLLIGAVLALLYPLLRALIRRSLRSAGLVRVFSVKADGDDTLLYCFPQDAAFKRSLRYTVYSATGKLLGLAQVDEVGARHCILRLAAGQARAGCLIGRPAEERSAGRAA